MLQWINELMKFFMQMSSLHCQQHTIICIQHYTAPEVTILYHHTKFEVYVKLGFSDAVN